MLYLLDTNVISELRKAKSGKINKNVLVWFAGLSSSSAFLSVITIMELEIGVLLVEKRDPAQGAVLRSWFENHVLPTFTDRILPIDPAVARQCAKLHVPDPCSDRDALIAATGMVHGMTVVTRNTSDFRMTGVELLNPWSEVEN